jgi:hypothetical protein
MTKSDKETLDGVLGALEYLMAIFKIERVLYLLGGCASLIIFIYASYRMFSSGEVTMDEMTLILGASGVSTACSSRIAYYLNRSFRLIEDIVRKLTLTGG